MISQRQAITNPQTFAATFLKILNKDKNLVPFSWNRTQIHFNAHRTGRDLILKARQLGMSSYVQGEMFRRTVTSTRSTITLAHDDTTTGLLRRMADRYWENCKFNDIQPMRKYANSTLATYPEMNSEAIIAKAGSQDVGRGATLTDFHGSEVAFWPDAEKIISGAMQGGNPDVILESTPNGAQGYFYEKCMDGSGIWTLHFYPWWWDASYSIDGGEITYTAEEAALVSRHNLTSGQIRWRRVKVKELNRLFVQEYPEDPVSCFLTSGASYFGDLSGVFTAPDGATWQEGHRYGAGLDFGQSNDFTALRVIDRTTHQEVDSLRINKLEWAEIRRRIKGMCDKWSRANCDKAHIFSGDNPKCPTCGSEKIKVVEKLLLLAESNSIGSVNIEQMRKDGVNVQPFATTNQSKADIMSDLNESLHAGGLTLLNNSVSRHELNTFVATQTGSGVWRLAAEGDGHDDTVIALALANQDVPIQIFV
jgi:predicted HicB family RNase H-like nuclease